MLQTPQHVFSVGGYEDCDDDDAVVHPTAEEICDGQYNDCDDPDYDAALAPEDETDVGSDGYVECDYDESTWQGSEDVVGGLDCGPNNVEIHPGAEELCDSAFNDCTHPLNP